MPDAEELQLLVTDEARAQRRRNGLKASRKTKARHDCCIRAARFPKRPAHTQKPPRPRHTRQPVVKPKLGRSWQCRACGFTLAALPPDLERHVTRGGRAQMRCPKCQVLHVIAPRYLFGVPFIQSTLAPAGSSGDDVPVT